MVLTPLCHGAVLYGLLGVLPQSRLLRVIVFVEMAPPTASMVVVLSHLAMAPRSAQLVAWASIPQYLLGIVTLTLVIARALAVTEPEEDLGLAPKICSKGTTARARSLAQQVAGLASRCRQRAAQPQVVFANVLNTARGLVADHGVGGSSRTPTCCGSSYIDARPTVGRRLETNTLARRWTRTISGTKMCRSRWPDRRGAGGDILQRLYRSRVRALKSRAHAPRGLAPAAPPRASTTAIRRGSRMLDPRTPVTEPSLLRLQAVAGDGADAHSLDEFRRRRGPGGDVAPPRLRAWVARERATSGLLRICDPTSATTLRRTACFGHAARIAGRCASVGCMRQTLGCPCSTGCAGARCRARRRREAAREAHRDLHRPSVVDANSQRLHRRRASMQLHARLESPRWRQRPCRRDRVAAKARRRRAARPFGRRLISRRADRAALRRTRRGTASRDRGRAPRGAPRMRTSGDANRRRGSIRERCGGAGRPSVRRRRFERRRAAVAPSTARRSPRTRQRPPAPGAHGIERAAASS